ncbi:MAG: TetR/AcrR family transcriptional regulator, partial [Microbacterium sp.]
MAHRGIYPKGVARRDEILDRALELVGSKGYSNVSLRDIAERVGVRPAALLHYFDSKEELFTEILRRRDERDEMSPSAESASASREAYLQIVRHNADVPGLIALYS